MGMFDFLSEAVKLPVDIARDVITLGGLIPAVVNEEDPKLKTFDRISKAYDKLDKE